MTKADLVDEVAALWEKVRGLEAQLTAAASERDKARQAALTEAALVPRKFAENAQRERQVGRYSDDYYVGVIDSCSNAATMIDLFGSESSEQIHDQIAAAARDQALGVAEAACEAVAKEHVGPQDMLAPPRRDYVYHEGQQVGAETCRDRIAALRTPGRGRVSRTFWRDPPAETEDYPGLVVCDNRVTGSITAGRSRLPLWCFTGSLKANWAFIEENWNPGQYGLTEEKFFYFIHCLLEARGELGRLLCVLADVERRDDELDETDLAEIHSWENRAEDRQRVRAQLQRCLDALTAPPAPEATEEPTP